MKWTKPNGTVIETNDMKETIEYCKSLGWNEVCDSTAPEPLAGEEPVMRARKSAVQPEKVVKPRKSSILKASHAK